MAEHLNINISAGTGIGAIVASGTNRRIDAIVQKDETYYYQAGSAAGLTFERLRVAGLYNATALSALIVGINSMIAMPLVIVNSTVITGIYFRVNCGGATGLVKLGLYTNSADTVLHPFQAIFTSGILPGSSVILVSANVVTTLSSNSLYWLAYMCGTNAPKIHGITPGGCWPIFHTDSGLGLSPGFGVGSAYTFATVMPATWGAGGSVVISANAPALAVKTSL